MKKERQVHMLPTEDKNSPLGITANGVLKWTGAMGMKALGIGKPQHLYITSNEEKKVGDWVYNCVSRHKSTNSHVYKIKEQSQVNNANTRKIIATTDPKLRNDIPTLNTMGKRTVYPQLLPQVPQSFVKEYCKQGGIDKVMVEYENCCSGTKNCECEYLEQCHSPVYKPKLIDNTIIISGAWIKEDPLTKELPSLDEMFPEEKMYSREEVEELLSNQASDIDDLYRPYTTNNVLGDENNKQWIKENL